MNSFKICDLVVILVALATRAQHPYAASVVRLRWPLRKYQSELLGHFRKRKITSETSSGHLDLTTEAAYGCCVLVANATKGVTPLPDGKGKEARLMIWSHPGDDVLGMVPRTHKVSSTCEQLMGGDEMYHYHTKIMMKDAKKGGGFNWHQDYGYWYKNGNLKPDLISLFMAVDPCIKENGGLEVLVGSHKCGRLDHDFEGGQQGLDPERMEEIRKIFDHFYVNLQPGDALFFHSNLLHGSEPNNSAMRRWAFNCSFNKKSNNPYKVHHHPQYVKLNKVPNSAVKDCNVFYDPAGKDYLDPAIDETVKVGSKQGTKYV